VWTASRMMMGGGTDGGRSRVPALQIRSSSGQVVQEVADNSGKGKLFFKNFFPSKPETSSVPQDFRYPPPLWEFTNINDEQIGRAIQKMKPYKATMTGTIPNSVFVNAKDALIPHLGPLFRATHNLAYYPDAWSLTETLVLKKPGKPDYRAPDAWRPIVL
ncbi:hypothetical protein FA15DRAFT_550179, partial [Coprinopsis marcescibilis]